MRCFHCAWKEYVSKKCLSLQLMKNSTETTDHKYPHSLQPVTVNHVENDQESWRRPLHQLKKDLWHQEEAYHQYYPPNLKLDLEDRKYPSLLDLLLWQYRHVENTNRVNAHCNGRQNPTYLNLLRHYQ